MASTAQGTDQTTHIQDDARRNDTGGVSKALKVARGADESGHRPVSAISITRTREQTNWRTTPGRSSCSSSRVSSNVACTGPRCFDSSRRERRDAQGHASCRTRRGLGRQTRAVSQSHPAARNNPKHLHDAWTRRSHPPKTNSTSDAGHRTGVLARWCHRVREWIHDREPHLGKRLRESQERPETAPLRAQAHFPDEHHDAQSRNPLRTRHAELDEPTTDG